MKKQHTIVKLRKGNEKKYTGTVEELTETFSYTLLSGNSYNPKINRFPKTIKALINNLNKSVDETQGGCYDPDYYFLAVN